MLKPNFFIFSFFLSSDVFILGEFSQMMDKLWQLNKASEDTEQSFQLLFEEESLRTKFFSVNIVPKTYFNNVTTLFYTPK